MSRVLVSMSSFRRGAELAVRVASGNHRMHEKYNPSQISEAGSENIGMASNRRLSLAAAGDQEFSDAIFMKCSTEFNIRKQSLSEIIAALMEGTGTICSPTTCVLPHVFNGVNEITIVPESIDNTTVS